ncbi:MAG: sigma 54-interacting transcriptional regulator [Clostridiales bacterium]|nr:sigma 54-interacting transcriptional regulator [Clostridiales bacterium]
MSALKEIASSVQQVADATGVALGVEVEIVDNELTIIGGTGKYAGMIGQKEEAGEIHADNLYARVLRSGATECVEDAVNSESYGLSAGYGGSDTPELAEICTPIKVSGRVIGIIGLFAINEEQKAILLDKGKDMVAVVEKMADLLAARAEQRKAFSTVQNSMSEMETLLEAAHEGIFSIDRNGYIIHCNNIAASLLKADIRDIIGKHLNKYMMGSPAAEVAKNGGGYTENEELYKNEKGSLHIIVTAKPFFSNGSIEGAVLSVRDIEEARKLVYNINTRALKCTFDDIMGESEPIQRAKYQALLTSRGNSTVLISGESGTGKEMFAKAIHYASARGGGPFITVNCGAIPENLLESELFGYERGAFTGASDKGKIGKFEMANGGTIFLDEIGDMPLVLQVKILHALQSMRFERVGGNRTIIVDVRVIAATNKNLEAMIVEGTFREDLYYRLSVIPLVIPPLRERREDIVPLMDYFLKKYNVFMNRQIVGFAKEVESMYMNYGWPGNIRELENAVEYNTNMAFGDIVGVDDVPRRITKREEQAVRGDDDGLTFSEQMRRHERQIIAQKLMKYGNTGIAKERIAKELGMSRATLYRKLSEFETNS